MAGGCRLADGRAGEEGTGVVARWCVRLFSGCPRARVRGPCSARGQASERVSRGRVLRLRDPAAQARPPPRLPSTFLNVLSVRGCALSFSFSPSRLPLSGTLAVLTSRSLARARVRFFCFSSLIPARRCEFFLGHGRGECDVRFCDDIGRWARCGQRCMSVRRREGSGFRRAPKCTCMYVHSSFLSLSRSR